MLSPELQYLCASAVITRFDPVFYRTGCQRGQRHRGQDISRSLQTERHAARKENRGKPDSKGKPEQQDNAAV
jgi:hypothetical protein